MTGNPEVIRQFPYDCADFHSLHLLQFLSPMCSNASAETLLAKSGLPCFSLTLGIDDHGSFVICRSVSVRPKHLSDQNFDHDY
jgi:hypothetical protein